MFGQNGIIAATLLLCIILIIALYYVGRDIERALCSRCGEELSARREKSEAANFASP